MKKLIFIILSVVIGSYVAWFVFPDNLMNNSSLGLIRHFSIDEFGLVAGTMKLYAHPFSSPDWYNSYPQLFYCAALLFLQPLLIFKGPDPALIINSFRFLNTISVFGILLLMSVFSKRFFGSFIPGITAACLSAITPMFMYFTLWSRPDAFEYLLIFCALFCFSSFILDEKRLGVLIWGIVVSALAFTTKYGGLFLIPLGVFLLYDSVVKGKTDSAKVLKISRITNKIVQAFILLAVPIIISVSYWGIFLYKIRSAGMTVWQAGDLQLANTVIVIAGILVFLMIVYAIGLGYIERRFRKLYIIASGFNFTALIFGVVYLIFNPYILTDPVKFLSVYGYRVVAPIFDARLRIPPGLSSGFFWFDMIGDCILMGRIVPVLAAAFMFLAILKMLLKRRIVAAQKIFMLLLSYAAILFAFLFFFIRHPGINFITPVVITLYLCFGYVVYYFFEGRRVHYFVSVVLLIAVLAFRFPYIAECKDGKGDFAWKKDPVYKVAGWLEKNAEAGSKVMTEVPLYYVPARFKKVAWIENAQRYLNDNVYFHAADFKDSSWIISEFGRLKDISPEIFIESGDKKFKSIREISDENEYLSRNYVLAAEFANGPDNASAVAGGRVLIYVKRKEQTKR